MGQYTLALELDSIAMDEFLQRQGLAPGVGGVPAPDVPSPQGQVPAAGQMTAAQADALADQAIEAQQKAFVEEKAGRRPALRPAVLGPDDPRGLVSPAAAAAQVEAAQGGPPLFQMSTTGESFVDGRPASTLDLLKGAFSGDFQVPPAPAELVRTPGPLEPQDPISQQHIQAQREFGEENTILGAPARLVDFLQNTPEGNRMVLELFGGTAGAAATGGASIATKAPAVLKAMQLAAARVGVTKPLLGMPIDMLAPIVSKIVSKIGPNLTRGLGAGAGEGAGSLFGSAAFGLEEDAFKNALVAAILGMFGEAIPGRLLKGGFESVPGSKTAIEQIGDRATIPAGNLTTARPIDVPQKIVESAPVGGGRFKKKAEEAELAALADLEDLSKRFVLDGGSEAAGAANQAALDATFEAGRAANTARYAELDEITEGVGVDLTEVLKRADEIAERADLTPGLREKAKTLGNSIRQAVQPEETIGTGVFDAAGNEITRVIEANNIVPWAQAAEFRSIALKVGRDPSEFIAGEAQAVGKRLSPIIGEAMDTAMEGLGKKALPLAKRARDKYKIFAETYEDNVVQLLSKRDPDKFVKTALVAESPVAIRRARKAVGNDQAWRAVQGQFIVDLMNKARDPETLRPLGGKIARDLRTFGFDALKEVFPDPGDLKMFNQVVRTLEITQQGAGKKLPGGILIQMQQAQSIQQLAFMLFTEATAATAGTAASAGTLLLGPHMVGRLLTNKKFVRWAVIGSKTKPGSFAARRAFSQMVLIHEREKQILEKRLKAERKKFQERPKNMDSLPQQRLAAPTAIP